MINIYKTLEGKGEKATVKRFKEFLNVSSVNTVKKYIDETPGFLRDNKGFVTYIEPECRFLNSDE